MDFEAAAKRVHLGRSVLFIGSGFSFGAKSKAKLPLVDAKGFSERLCDEIGEGNLPLDLATDEYLEKKSYKDLSEKLTNQFTVETFENFHSHISSLPWKRVFTTNYDDLIELSAYKAGRSLNTATLSDDPKDVICDGLVVHLNGFIRRLSKDHYDNDFILSDSHYLTEKFRESSWSEFFRTDLEIADAIFFIGYSLYDFDVARILFENPSLARKTFFVVGEGCDRKTELRVKKFGSVVLENAAEVASYFPKKDEDDAVKPSEFTVGFDEVVLEQAAHDPDNNTVRNLLVKGEYVSEFGARSILSKLNNYNISRGGLPILEGHVGSIRILLHANIGCGKSLALEEVVIRAVSAGKRVFRFNGKLTGLKNDFSYFDSIVINDDVSVMLVIEQAFDHAKFIKAIIDRFPQFDIVVTSRSAAVETRLGSISDAFGVDFTQIDLNELDDIAVDSINKLLHSHGMWFDKQGMSEVARKRYINRECKKQLSSLLMSVCRSDDLFRRFELALQDAGQIDKSIFLSLVASLALAYDGHAPSVAQLCEVVQDDLFKLGRIQGNELIKEFVAFEKDRVTIRSPMFAQAILRDLVDDVYLVDELPFVIARLDYLKRNNSFYDRPAKSLMRFAFIEPLLKGNDRGPKLVAYYENIRSTGVGISNPQFWLQYAMALMFAKDYLEAQNKFETAFGVMAGRSYDPYKVENHFAKFLLESRTATDHWSDFYESFMRAHVILREQMKRFREGLYPYRVASLYLNFIEVRWINFDHDQRLAIIRACEEILEVSEMARPQIRRSSYFKDCTRLTQAALDFMKE